MTARQRSALLALTIIGSSLSCERLEAPLADEGIVQGAAGCTRILTSTRALQPLTMPAQFRVDSFRIRFTYRNKPTNNICQVGDVIELIHIELAP
jgi:hypothetical protein